MISGLGQLYQQCHGNGHGASNRSTLLLVVAFIVFFVVAAASETSTLLLDCFVCVFFPQAKNTG